MKISFISSRDRLGIRILFRYSLDSFSQAEVTAFDLKAMNQAHENQNSDKITVFRSNSEAMRF